MKLKSKDAELFAKLYTDLLIYANKKLGIDDEKIFQDDVPGFEERVAAVRDAMWENETCIQDYIDEVADTVTKRELALLESWQIGINGQFLVGKNYKDYSLFINMNTGEMYGVIGSVEYIKNMTPDTILPVFVETALLPFEGKIITDGFVGVSEPMPQEMRWDLIKEINQKRNEQETIMDLEEHMENMVDYILNNHFDEIEADILKDLEGEEAEFTKVILDILKKGTAADYDDPFDDFNDHDEDFSYEDDDDFTYHDDEDLPF